MLRFDDATLAILEECYRGRDFQKRRATNLAALSPAPGATICDLGCGNGMLTEDLSRAVGGAGQVIGVDPSPEMLASAKARCASLGNVRLMEGTAEAIPLPDRSVDGLLSLQVMEYVARIDKGLAECARILRPGGRLVIGDMLFSSLIWRSDDPGRMARFNAHWAEHVAWTDLPQRLPEAIVAAGLVVEDIAPLTFLDAELRPDGIAAMMLILIEAYVIQNGLASKEEAADWRAEQVALARDGRFFFALTHVVTTARKP